MACVSVSAAATRGGWPVWWALALALCGLSACESPESRPDTASLLDQGDALFESKNYREAAKAYRQAVNNHPLDGASHAKLANALWLAQEWGDGALEAIRAADLLPGNRDLQLVAASRSLTLRRFSEADARASTVLETDPSNVEALLVRANAMAHLQDSHGRFTTWEAGPDASTCSRRR